MEVQTSQTLATNIILISIALVAATLIVINPVWRSFRACRKSLSNTDLGEIKWVVAAICVLSALIYGTNIAMDLFGAEVVQSVVHLAIFSFIALGLIAVVVISVWRFWRAFRERSWPNINWSTEFDPKQSRQTQYAVSGASLCNLVMVLILSTGAMTGAMDVSLGTQVSTQSQDDFDMSKWMLRAAIPGFGIGLLMIAAGEFVDFWSGDNKCGKHP